MVKKKKTKKSRIVILFDIQYLDFYSSNLLWLSMSGGYQLHSWFTNSMLLLFLRTASFWVMLTWISQFFFFIFLQCTSLWRQWIWESLILFLICYNCRWQGWMKDYHSSMQYLLFLCFRLLGLSSPFVQDLYTFRIIRFFLCLFLSLCAYQYLKTLSNLNQLLVNVVLGWCFR